MIMRPLWLRAFLINALIIPGRTSLHERLSTPALSAAVDGLLTRVEDLAILLISQTSNTNKLL
jgi:hypothetical protein